MEKFLENLSWRYATKEFDETKKVTQQDLENIIEVFRLSASSFGLQPWKLFIIEKIELKQKIMENSFHQKQVGHNSHLLVFAKLNDINEDLVDRHLYRYSQISGYPRETFSLFEQTLMGFINNHSQEYLGIWAKEQIYIALGNVMAFLAEKRIDSCAIGGFDKNEIDEILGLKEKGFSSVVMLPIGYRNENDKNSKREKVRFLKEEIVEIL